MQCPFCGTTIQLADATCSHCRSAIGYLQDRIFIGRQFAFFDAQPNQPITVRLMARSASQWVEQHFDEPTILSRHDYGIRLGSLGPKSRRVIGLWDRPSHEDAAYATPDELPAITFPTLDLLTVVTERKIYRPQDEVHIFAVAPGNAGRAAEIEVQLAGQRVYLANVTLDDAGLYVQRYADLEAGEYQVVLRLRDRPGAQAACTFSCAEFTLSPLIAILESHEINNRRLQLRLNIKQLTLPYSGPAHMQLLQGREVMARQATVVEVGRLTAEFCLDFDWWDVGVPLALEIVTPEGNTATVALPGTSTEEREHITLSPLDTPVEASLAPFAGQAGTVRGLHYGPTRSSHTLFTLPEVIARTGRLRAERAALLVRLVVFNPLDGSQHVHDFRSVNPGDELTFTVDAPYSLFTLAAFMAAGEPYEAWGVVVAPVTVQAGIEAPQTALPGQLIEVNLTSDAPARGLLLVYDARLEHESPLPKLARCLFTHLRDRSGLLKVQRLAPLVRATSDQAEGWDTRDFLGFRPVEGLSEGMMRKLPTEVEGGLEAIEMVVGMLVAPRASFPELAFLELFPVDGPVRKTIRLGDQIGTWRCRAYLFRGLDYVELTHDIQVEASLYAELDLPAILGEGDAVTATSRYHTVAPARLTITTPAEEFSYGVLGDGVVEFPLTVPGLVRTSIQAGETVDVSQRTVDTPGVETVTVSRWMLLQPDETASGQRVVILPNSMPALQSAIDYLINYPFG
jgi:hypothetical protein